MGVQILISGKTASVNGTIKGAVVTTSGGSAAKESAVITKTQTAQEISTFYIPWGDGNSLPTTIRNYINQNSVLSSAMQAKTRCFVSGGLKYGKYEINKINNIPELIPYLNPEVRSWMLSTNVNRLAADHAFELYSFGNVFIRLILTKDRTQIARMFVEQSTQCRLAKPDNQGRIRLVYVSGDWEKNKEEETVTKIPYLDPYKSIAEQIAASSAYEFMFVIRNQDSGREFYHAPDWYSAVQSKWLEVSKEIPLFKLNVLKNQLTLKYHIEISDLYFASVIPGFADKNADEQKSAIEDKIKDLEDFVSGTENASKSFVSMFGKDFEGKELGIKITPLKDNTLDGKFNDDSAEASLHILFATGVDGSIIGTVPGKTLGAGSGSDKREAYNILTAQLAPDQEQLLDLLRQVSLYNGWDGEWYIDKTYLSTLNKVGPASRNAQ